MNKHNRKYNLGILNLTDVINSFVAPVCAAEGTSGTSHNWAYLTSRGALRTGRCTLRENICLRVTLLDMALSLHPLPNRKIFMPDRCCPHRASSSSYLTLSVGRGTAKQPHIRAEAACNIAPTYISESSHFGSSQRMELFQLARIRDSQPTKHKLLVES